MTRSDITKYWLDNYFYKEVGICSLCGNKGFIDTTGRAASAAGVQAGRINYCLCPNGQAMRLGKACLPTSKDLERFRTT